MMAAICIPYTKHLQVSCFVLLLQSYILFLQVTILQELYYLLFSLLLQISTAIFF